MPQIGSFVQGLYRDESRSTSELVAALCKAVMEYLPVELDEVGYRNGHSYRYASIHSIRRSTLAANCKHGLFLNHVYSESDKGEHVTTVLRHASGEYVASTSPVPHLADVQDAKAAKTLLCRTHSEGLLGIVTERDDDGQSVSRNDGSVEQREAWSARWKIASAAIAAAPDVAAVDRLEATAKKRVEEGALAPDMVPEIERVCRDRRDQLEKEKTTNDGISRTDAAQGADAAGGGNGAPNRRAGRATAGA